MLREFRSLAVVAAASFFGGAPLLAAADDAPMPNVQVEKTLSPSGFSLSAGATYWTGDFGFPTRSHLFSAALSARYAAADIRVWATLPWMSVRSDATLFAGMDGGPIFVSAATPPQGREREGLGDLTLGGTWTAVDGGLSAPTVDLTTRVKLPTASDSSGLSTGKTDVALSADVSMPVGGIIPYISGGYTFLGDPDGFDLRNPISAAAGFSAPIGPREAGVLVLAYEYDRSSSAVFGDRHELFGALSFDVAQRINLTGYATVGLNEAAADTAVGLLTTFAF